ncbi:FecR domain-containing protein [Dasania sp. GY-MA-18]|uniref:FecR domain-containing protein n=1 Tax=Dasania phycosphaerae TaxID=2950436 RepID=A0A9J6RLS7_9GAMM|nr:MULTISPECIES: FecR domain-containing protein [Dasania]MCR8922973.1 FecR domain-containing protein [Dasania sp. GY-MA-18]MCZ0865404.1 FecR domain-containing protein [Dasania phycosphaerae]MCZ0869129.1 FecR domain-containing protein [Dasania phycosphaerae]
MNTDLSVSKGAATRVETEANEWFLRIREGGLSSQEHNAWSRWMTKDAAHEQAFQEVEQLWAELSDLADIGLPTEAELAADDYQGDMPISQWLQQQSDEQPAIQQQGRETRSLSLWQQLLNGSPLQYAMSAAASVLLLGFIVLMNLGQNTGKVPSVESFQTGHGQHKQVALADGSVIELGAESILTVSYQADSRDVNLVSGEAYFKVASDKTRPFTVQTGSGFVQVVGTAFNIDRDDSSSTITVLEGHVRVASQRQALVDSLARKQAVGQHVAELLAGDQLVVDGNGVLGQVQKVDASASISWREGLLVFVKQPMGDVISELNRYSKQRIILANASISNIDFTGTVDKTRIAEWLVGLEKAYPIRVSIIDEKTVLLFDKTL